MRKLVVAMLAVIALTAHADPQPIINPGFLTGYAYLKMTESARRTYITGLTEGFLLSSKFGAPKGNVLWLEECIVSLGPRELTPGVDQFLRAHPERLRLPIHQTSLLALQDACVHRDDG